MGCEKITTINNIVTGLTDVEMVQGGLKKVHAYIRVEQDNNAKRQEKHRDKKKDEEVRQINIMAPSDDDTREVLRELVKGLIDKKLNIDQLKDLLNSDKNILKPDPVIADTLSNCRVFLEAGGLRGHFIKLLARRAADLGGYSE